MSDRSCHDSAVRTSATLMTRPHAMCLSGKRCVSGCGCVCVCGKQCACVCGKRCVCLGWAMLIALAPRLRRVRRGCVRAAPSAPRLAPSAPSAPRTVLGADAHHFKPNGAEAAPSAPRHAPSRRAQIGSCAEAAPRLRRAAPSCAELRRGRGSGLRVLGQHTPGGREFWAFECHA